MNNKITFTAIVLLLLVIIATALGFTHIGFLQSFRIVFGSVYVLFLPGFILTFAFFPAKNKTIDATERIALSFALSIAIVPLVVFYLNLLGLKITFLNTFLIILGIILISSIILYFQNRKRQV